MKFSIKSTDLIPLAILALMSCQAKLTATVPQAGGLTPPTGDGGQDGRVVWPDNPPPPIHLESPLPAPSTDPIQVQGQLPGPSPAPVQLPTPHFPPAVFSPVPTPLQPVLLTPSPLPAALPLPAKLPGEFGTPKSFVSSHDSFAKPYFFTRGVQGVFGDSHGGYGYLAGSEALADSQFHFGCAKSEMEGYLAMAPVKEPKAIEELATQRLREELFEFLTLRYAALDAAYRPVKILSPAGNCVHPKSSGFIARDKLPSALPTDEEIFKAAPELKGLLIKYRGAAMQLEPLSWTFALVLDDHFAHQEKDYCTDSPDEAACFDIRAIRARLLTDFEALFHLPDARYQEFLKKIITYVGASLLMDEQSGATEPQKAFERGRAFYNASFDQTPEAVARVQQGVARAAQNSKDPKVTALLKSVSDDLMSSFSKVIRANRIRLEFEADHLCERDLNYLVKTYPNVVRQSILDLPGDERAAVQYQLCSLPSFQASRPKYSCQGISSTGSGVQVDRRSPSYPYSSSNHYGISALSTGVTEVALTVNFTFDKDFGSNEQAKVLANWQASANSWYNCQVGSLGSSTLPALDGQKPVTLQCPAEPGLVYSPITHFKIALKAVPAGTHVTPLVKVHRCYRSELSDSEADATNCTKVRAFAVQSCQNRCASSDSACRQDCEDGIPPAGDPFNNRQNSGNFVVAQEISVLYHEFGHLMGLDDEYTDLSLPLNLIGETASVMRNSHSVWSRIYPRQVSQMLEPLRCLK